MTHIEFLGAPGTGKSTIYDAISSEKILQPNRKEVIGVSPFTEIPLLKPIFKNISQLYWQVRLQEHYVANHISHRPLVGSLLQYIAEHTENDAQSLIRILFTTIASYEYGKELASDNDVVCLDEGFAQRCLGVFLRGASVEFSIATFADHIPVPDVLVQVDAPAEVCKKRQLERGLVKTNEVNEINGLKNYGSEIANELEERGTRVIYIQNDHDINSAVSAVEMEVEEALVELTNEF